MVFPAHLKRIVFLLLAFFLLFSMTACNRKDDGANPPSGVSNPAGMNQGMLSVIDMTNATFSLIPPASFTTPPSPDEASG